MSSTHEFWMPGSISPRHQQQPGNMRKSIFGTVREKLSRKDSHSSQKSTLSSDSSERRSRIGRSPSTDATTAAAATTAASTRAPAATGRNSNPFSNPSPPTRRPANDPPPAYTPNPTVESGPTVPAGLSSGNSARGTSPAPSVRSAISTTEDPYAFLSTFDTIFVIDDSGSMAGRSWREVKEALRTITPICTAHDADGVDVYFLNHRSSAVADLKTGKAAGGYRGVVDAATVERVFTSVRPGGGTPTGTRLHQILKPYLQLCSDKVDNMDVVKPINMIVITDGVPSDDVESVLVSAAKKLDKLEAPPYQVGVQFFQVGNEPGAREALRDLDDGLTELVDGGVRDMVDTVTWDVRNGAQTPVLTAEGILKTVLGAVVRRIDRRRISGERLRV